MSDGAGGHGAGVRILLLASQAFTLGLTMAWLLVPATAIFLDEYGSGLLPVTYIGAALAGAASSAALGRALRRRPIASVAVQVLGGLVVTLLASWAILWRADAAWVSFALLVLVPIVIPVGFLFLVGQAGALLDVRALKSLYARVVAGFALGFVVGGIAAPVLLGVLGATEHLLAASAAASTVFLLLLTATRRRFPVELGAIEQTDEGVLRPTLRAVLRDRYVVLLVAFQMLSAVESQWLDYLVFDRAAQRYEGDELARFVGRFTAIAYGADILFLLLFAGLLLRRFGLRYGLTANPAAVLALVTAVVVAATLQGSGATLVFVLAVGARATDLTMGDGAARTSMSAAYQVVPRSSRQVAQAAVEGLAVPTAIGVSGVGLLVVRATVGTDGLALPLLIGADVLVWIAVAGAAYRRYRTNLLDSLRHRQLDPAGLVDVDPGSIEVIDRLLGSEDEHDVRLGLETLELGAYPALLDQLRRFVSDPRDAVRVDALERLTRVDGAAAARAAREGLDDRSPAVRAACVRALGATGVLCDVMHAARWLGDGSPEVKAAAAQGATSGVCAPCRAEVAVEIRRLAAAPSPSDRLAAAVMLGACNGQGSVDRTSLAELVRDLDPDVANAALAATSWPPDAHLVPDVMGALGEGRTAGAAVDAFVRGGDVVLPAIDVAFDDERLGRQAKERLARACRLLGGAPAIAVLERHVNHPDREVGLAVMAALGAIVPPGSAPGAPLDDDLEHGGRVLQAIAAFDVDPLMASLLAALRDELDLVRARVVAALATRLGADAMDRVVFQLAQPESRDHAMALEWLDVTLKGTDRAAVALLEPHLSDEDRLRRLARTVPLPALDATELLIDLAEDSRGTWRQPWLRACALYGAWGTVELDLDALAGDRDDGIVAETLEALRLRVAP